MPSVILSNAIVLNSSEATLWKPSEPSSVKLPAKNYHQDMWPVSHLPRVQPSSTWLLSYFRGLRLHWVLNFYLWRPWCESSSQNKYVSSDTMTDKWGSRRRDPIQAAEWASRPCGSVKKGCFPRSQRATRRGFFRLDFWSIIILPQHRLSELILKIYNTGLHRSKLSHETN